MTPVAELVKAHEAKLPARDPHALDSATVANVLLTGDLEKLNDQQRMAYCTKVCETLGLNPLTQPFAFIRLNGRLVMYAKKDATEQLRKLHGVSITQVTSQRIDDVFVVNATATDRTGRADAATGAVAIGNLKGEALANALMKAETKAKRRVTLSICGLGMLDETEVETVPNAPVVVEARKRIDLPAGTLQILKVDATQWGASIEFVDEHGVVITLPTTERQCAELAEQIAQENVPVQIVSQQITRGKNAGKYKVTAIHRWAPPSPAVEAEPLTVDQIPF